MTAENLQPQATFEGLGIAPKILEILAHNKFVHPTPIQHQAIPVAVEGKDVMGIAQTGTGKTMAFGIPMIQRLAQHKGRGLVILPTRELALQVDESLQKIGRSLGLKTAVLIGGEPIHRQFRQLKQNPHIIIGTPGRINDHLEQKTINLAAVTILVLDEADRMLDMGFEPQIKKILAHVPKQRQTMLFSATMPNEIVKIATAYMSLPIRVEVAPAGTTARDVSQELFFVPRDKKLPLLKKVLEEHKGSVLVFTRTKFTAKKIAKAIRDFGYTAAEIHSNRSLGQRREALEGFKIGRYKILAATDIAARGIDVTGIELVLNYDLPENPEDYVHRIGRTGRAGLSGKAVSFATPDQRYDVKGIERLIKTALPVKTSPELSASVLPFQAQPRHAYVRDQQSRGPKRFDKPRTFDRPRSADRAGYRSKSKFKSRSQEPRRNPNAPQDQGFDAHHTKPFRPHDPNRISYRNDSESF